MLEGHVGGRGIVLAIPAGGLPVGAVVARRLNLPLDVAVVSKVTLPWNTEAGYGAVAFDGTVVLNEALLAGLGLGERQMREGLEATRTKVARRLKALRGDRPMPDLAGRAVILVDDGLASGFTLLAAVEAVRKAGAKEIALAVPTAHAESARRVAAEVEVVYCPNVRGGWRFAVAEAYEHWYDVSEHEAAEILDEFTGVGGED